MDGLPVGVEITADVPGLAQPLLMSAMDLTRPVFDSFLAQHRPDFAIFDFSHWLSDLSRAHRVRPVVYATVNVSFFAYLSPLAWDIPDETPLDEDELKRALLGFPLMGFDLRAHEARGLAMASRSKFGLDGLSLLEVVLKGLRECDAVCCKSCKEMEGPLGDYFEKHYGKPVLWAGPVVPKPPVCGLDEELDGWLKRFEEGSVVYCALGSECVLKKEQFQELLLGLELTDLPFLAALKLPIECETVEEALPAGFSERTKERGIVNVSWVQQQLILQHISVGCFVTHCGAGSLTEALLSKCQLVLLPQGGDQFINARLMSEELRVGVEVKRQEEDGFFTPDAVHKAVMAMTKPRSELGKKARANHDKWREFLLREGLEESYINGLVQNLQGLLG